MKHTAYVAAIALALAGIAPLGCKEEPAATPATSPGEAAGNAVESGVNNTTQAAHNAVNSATDTATDMKNTAVANIAPSGAAALDGVRSAIEGIVQNATDRNEYDAMADHFTKADADRVKNGKPDTKDLDELVEKFSDAWSKKYDDKFSSMDATKVFSPDFIKLATSSASTPDHAMGTAAIAASHGQPELDMTFMEEGGKWRLDIPDDVDAQKLHDNLFKALTDLQDTSTWPGDKVDAERLVSHRLLAAIMNK